MANRRYERERAQKFEEQERLRREQQGKPVEVPSPKKEEERKFREQGIATFHLNASKPSTLVNARKLASSIRSEASKNL